MVFGTIYHITYQSDTNYQKEIEAELQKVDNSLSPFNKTSIISRVNRNEKVKVDEMFTEVFQLAEKISGETNGAFDITVAPMVNAWGFGFKTGNPPTKPTIDSLRAIVGFHKVALKDGFVSKENPKTMLDCSAIAKGYGTDIVARYLKKKGIQNFMVEIGGEIVVSGNSEKQVPWRIGINKPTIATSTIRMARNMRTPSTRRRATLCSTTSCRPQFWQRIVPQPMPMPPHSW